LESRQYHLRRPFFIREEFVVPNAEHFKALRTQIGIALFIARAFSMLPAIELDD
jgi:hypothetical protein